MMSTMIGITMYDSSASCQSVTSMIPMMPISTRMLLMMLMTVSENMSWMTLTSFWMRVITVPTPRRSM